MSPSGAAWRSLSKVSHKAHSRGQGCYAWRELFVALSVFCFPSYWENFKLSWLAPLVLIRKVKPCYPLAMGQQRWLFRKIWGSFLWVSSEQEVCYLGSMLSPLMFGDSQIRGQQRKLETVEFERAIRLQRNGVPVLSPTWTSNTVLGGFCKLRAVTKEP